MNALKIEGEARRDDSCLTWADVNISDSEKFIKKITLTVEAGDLAVLEIEEYISEPTINQSIMTTKTTHLVNF